MNSETHLTYGENLSIAWARVFLKSMEKPSGSHFHHHMVIFPVHSHENISPTNESNEDTIIRGLVDNQLRTLDKHTCHTVANTIFPVSLWNPEVDRQQLYSRYLRLWSTGYLKQIPANRHGTYFQRLTAYQNENEGSKNQLEHIITTYEKGNHRASALQASIMNPSIDHSDARQRGFPCLQHVHFAIHPSCGELEITGIYATQLIIEKAYGNYLGLLRLGQFMAHEMGFKLTRVVCIASLLKRSASTVTKGQLGYLKNQLFEVMNSEHN